MNISKKIQFATEADTSGSEVLILSYRSNPGSSTNTGNLCADEVADVVFYIYSSSSPVVSTGDIAYNTNNLTSPFNGANKYYKVAYAEFIDTDTFIVQIDAVGVMTVQETCVI